MSFVAGSRRRVLRLCGALVLATGLFGGTARAEEPLQVVATTGMIADIVRNVAGEHAAVTQLMGQGVDPHLYKATRSDVTAMLRADVVFYNGLLLEGKLTDALVRVAGSGRPVHPVTELVEESYLLEPPEFQGLYDPHLWMDPSAWTHAVEAVRDKLIEQDPDHAETYRVNAEAYLAELGRLDAYAKEVLATVPPEQRILVTAHDAFNYFGRRYGFEVLGIQGISTESEAGLKRVEQLVDLLVERALPAVFVETTIPERSVRALIAGAADRGHRVEMGGTLFSDAMGAPGTYEGTYIGMIDHNVTTIARALGGTTPEKGLHGRLTLAEGQ
ncbi:MAG TPA: zinc ABC transporter substrate-binding protein [Geminicoccaceae bacterium]|nr:zinc ABC transporter substrate-binding protein [Geminicoccaceae bacterium]